MSTSVTQLAQAAVQMLTRKRPYLTWPSYPSSGQPGLQGADSIRSALALACDEHSVAFPRTSTARARSRGSNGSGELRYVRNSIHGGGRLSGDKNLQDKHLPIRGTGRRPTFTSNGSALSASIPVQMIDRRAETAAESFERSQVLVQLGPESPIRLHKTELFSLEELSPFHSPPAILAKRANFTSQFGWD